MSPLPFVIAIGALAMLAGCTTVPPEQRAANCAQTDWHRYGVNDGMLGVPGSERADLFADCTRLGQPADIARYQTGHEEGLKQYCTAENGYEVGRQGRRYHDVCPTELEPDFLQGLAQGRRERPAYGVHPSIGIGIGSGGGVRSGIGIGIGGWGYGGRYSPFYDDCYWRDPFPCSWRRHGMFGHPLWW